MSFAKDMSCRLIDESPEQRKKSKSKHFDLKEEKYNTLTEPHESIARSTSKSNCSVFNNMKGRTRFEKMIIQKLAYEWKNIYRQCVTTDRENLDIININEFVSICDKNGASIILTEQK